MARKPEGYDRWSPAKQKAHAKSLEKRQARHQNYRADQLAEKAAALEAQGHFDIKEIKKRDSKLLAEQGDTARIGTGLGKQTSANGIKASNKLTEAFELMGGVPALVRWGRLNATEFYRIWARLIPKEAVEPTGTMPLEELLAQLATKSEKSVAVAAYELGNEVLVAARHEISIEDARAMMDDDGETIQ